MEEFNRLFCQLTAGEQHQSIPLIHLTLTKLVIFIVLSSRVKASGW